jgi:hypothetical protein
MAITLAVRAADSVSPRVEPRVELRMMPRVDGPVLPAIMQLWLQFSACLRPDLHDHLGKALSSGIEVRFHPRSSADRVSKRTLIPGFMDIGAPTMIMSS